MVPPVLRQLEKGKKAQYVCLLGTDLLGTDLSIVQGFFLDTIDASPSMADAALRLSIYPLKNRSKVLREWEDFLPPGLQGVLSQRLLPQRGQVIPSLRGAQPWFQALITSSIPSKPRRHKKAAAPRRLQALPISF